MADDYKKKKKNQPMLLMGDRPLPQNEEAEVAVLGCMLLSPREAIDAAGSKLQPAAFYHDKHRLIFSAIRELGERPEAGSIDVITLSDYLSRKGELDQCGGEDYLFHLLNSVPSAANVESYVEIVYEQWVLRQLITAGSDMVSKCFDRQTAVKELMDTIEQQVFEIGQNQSKQDYIVIKDLVKGVVNHVQQLSQGLGEATGVQTGYPDLDKMIVGMRPGNMVVLAARPSIGKTALALNIAQNICLDNPEPVGCGIFSLEMGADQLVLRMLVSASGIPISEIRDGQVTHGRWVHLLETAQRLKEAPIYIDETPQIDILELRAKARRMKREHNIGCIMIDYLQLMQPPAGTSASSREQEVAKISAGIKALAKELEIPIIVLAQLNRAAEQPGQRPKLANLRESGSIEQDADLVFLLHRDREQQHEASEEKAADGFESELIVAKNRQGQTGVVKMLFKGRLMRYFSYSGIDDSDVPAG